MYQYGGSEANLGRTSPARPPAPPNELPAPSYNSYNSPALRHSDDGLLTRFFASCAAGEIEQVSQCLEHLRPATPTAAFEFALEEASQNLHHQVVDLLLRKTSVRVHYRCFRRRLARQGRQPEALQCIFTSRSDRLLDLITTFLAHGWNPSLLIEPLAVGDRTQLMVLHYPRCLRDEELLKLLLGAGANPNISRIRKKPVERALPGDVIPVEQGDGRVLELALNWAAIGQVQLLVSHGAKIEDARGFHSLARRRAALGITANQTSSPSSDSGQISHAATSGTPYPNIGDADRLKMAEALLQLGADINDIKDVYRCFTWPTMIAMFPCHRASPLEHAAGCGDWVLAKWLILHGANTDIRLEPLEAIYNLPRGGGKAAQTAFHKLVADTKRERISIRNFIDD